VIAPVVEEIRVVIDLNCRHGLPPSFVPEGLAQG
jgi:hypothetical protein